MPDYLTPDNAGLKSSNTKHTGEDQTKAFEANKKHKISLTYNKVNNPLGESSSSLTTSEVFFESSSSLTTSEVLQANIQRTVGDNINVSVDKMDGLAQDPDCGESGTSFTAEHIGIGSIGAGANETDGINELLQDCSTDGESDSGLISTFQIFSIDRSLFANSCRYSIHIINKKKLSSTCFWFCVLSTCMSMEQ